MNIRFVLCVMLLGAGSQLFGQSAVFPDNGTLYDGKLHRIDLLMHADSLTALLSDSMRWSNHSFPATFVYDGEDTLYNVGVRMKGNTSRNSAKLSFKIDVDEFDNQSYQGLKTFNLNGNHNDPSISREYMSTYVMNADSNVSLRANPVQLYLNGNLRGIYTHAEQINKKFLSSRFNENSGNLYKCSWPADLKWLGSNPQSYKDIINPSPLNERAYELKTNETADDYNDLVTLINVINNTPQASFQSAIDTVFDVQAYLKVLAAEVMIGHWDNYFYNKNNYYLYHHQATGKFIYIPYDMDNTWGVQWGVSNIDVRNIYQWGNAQNTSAPLTNKILAVPQFKQDYERYLRALCSGVYTETNLFAVLDSIKQQLLPAVTEDPFYNNLVPTDYGYTVSDWNNSYTEAIDDHATFGVKPFITSRRNSALSKLPPASGLGKTHLAGFTLSPNPMQQMFSIALTQDAVVTVYSVQGQTMLTYQLKAGAHQLMHELKPGLYWMMVSQSNQTGTVKFIVE